MFFSTPTVGVWLNTMLKLYRLKKDEGCKLRLAAPYLCRQLISLMTLISEGILVSTALFRIQAIVITSETH